jgi:hypothetical protein
MSDTRIPIKDSEFFNYLYETSTHLAKPYRPPVIQGVPADTTVNLLSEDLLPANMLVTLANTGAAGTAPDLHFCLGFADGDACTVGSAVAVVAGASTTVLISALGGADMNNINVTNVHATDNSSCQLDFQPNWQRLGLLESQKNAWVSKAELLLKKHLLTQSENTRTPALVTERNQLKAAFFDFAEPILKQIEGSLNLMPEDRNVFNIPIPDRTRTPRGPIGDSKPVVEMFLEGTGNLRFRCRVGEDSNRASRHPLSDGIEIKYALLNIGDPPPVSVDACPNSYFSSKALFVLALGAEAAGKKFYGFARWVNTSNPANNGTWCLMFQALVV